MNTFMPELAESAVASFKIRGRMVSYEEFIERLKGFCTSLGFGPVTIHMPSPSVRASSVGSVDQFEGKDEVVVVSTSVAYNPSWGVLGGMPHLFHQKKDGGMHEETPADFIAPFLLCYSYAQENIHLSLSAEGQCLITLPESIVREGVACAAGKLRIHLDRIVEADTGGVLRPVMTSDTQQTFVVTGSLSKSMAELLKDWQAGRTMAIGQYLKGLFSFQFAERIITSDSPYVATILPHLAEIVTHATPNLRAAQRHLLGIFARDVARLAEKHKSSSGKLMYITGLDIDMTAFTGEEDHYFVPCQAYIAESGDSPEHDYLLVQDDLLGRLRQQDKHYVV
ncbi:MAG: hypothetical protein OEL83_01940 [Desulforhopalus sp.]|nr:hypothetical protein [Desulforhopalus sp.]